MKQSAVWQSQIDAAEFGFEVLIRDGGEGRDGRLAVSVRCATEREIVHEFYPAVVDSDAQVAHEIARAVTRGVEARLDKRAGLRPAGGD